MWSKRALDGAFLAFSGGQANLMLAGSQTLRLVFNMKLNPSTLRIGLLIIAISSASCDKQKKLQQEHQRVDTEAERVLAEIQTLDQRILSLGAVSASATITIERQTAALEQKAVHLKGEIDALKAKLKSLESAAATFGPKVDAYKAKYLR